METSFRLDDGRQRSQRQWRRHEVEIPGRMVWRDARGTTRFATVVTKNVSEQGAFVECLSGAPIPLYRLVYLQLERTARSSCDLPECLRQGKVLSAIYRVGATTPKTGTPHGYALRLLIEPRRLSHAQRGAEDEGHSATA